MNLKLTFDVPVDDAAGIRNPCGRHNKKEGGPT